MLNNISDCVHLPTQYLRIRFKVTNIIISAVHKEKENQELIQEKKQN